ncbi:hypothetical protein PS1_034923 [Malus domestica]
MTFAELHQLIARKTGGISVNPVTSSVRAEDLFKVMYYVLQEVQFTDKMWFKETVSQFMGSSKRVIIITKLLL